MVNENLNRCPIFRSVPFLGDAWNLLILREAFSGVTRFDGFRKNLGIAPTMLTKRLNQLTEEGLLQKHRYSEHPPRDEYLLIPAGRDTLPLLLMLREWGKKHRCGQAGDRLLDAQTGQEIRPLLIDAVSGAPIGEREIVRKVLQEGD